MSNEPNDRRGDERFLTYVAVEIEGQGKKHRFGVTRDASTGGLLLSTPSRFEVGTELTLRPQDASGNPGTEVVATVIRVDEATPGSDEPWRYQLAVRFTDPDAASRFLAEAKGPKPRSLPPPPPGPSET